MGSAVVCRGRFTAVVREIVIRGTIVVAPVIVTQCVSVAVDLWSSVL